MGVLAGTRVIDFGRYIAGPYCGALLGDLGAEVIRVERVEGGEDRWITPVTVRRCRRRCTCSATAASAA